MKGETKVKRLGEETPDKLFHVGKWSVYRVVSANTDGDGVQDMLRKWDTGFADYTRAVEVAQDRARRFPGVTFIVAYTSRALRGMQPTDITVEEA